MTSQFSAFLAEMIERVHGCLGIVLQDWDGETVEVFGHMDREELMIHGAQWGLVWRMCKYGISHRQIAMAQEILIQTSTQKILIHSLFEDYYLVVFLAREASLQEALNHMRHMILDIKEEMGL